MGYFYATQTEQQLRTLRSKKFNRKTALEKQASTYLNMQERKTLAQQIMWIDAELAARKEQIALF